MAGQERSDSRPTLPIPFGTSRFSAEKKQTYRIIMFKDSSHLPNKIECKDIVNISIIQS